jgi:maleylacetoacetate isomerase
MQPIWSQIMTQAIVLHDYWRSSSAYRVRIALNVLGLPYERVAVDLVKGDQTEPAHLALNVQGLVPVLEIDGQILTQSVAIIEYLNDTRRAGFLPDDPLQRHQVRGLAYAIAMEIQPVCNLRVVKHAVSLGGSATNEAWMKHFITLGLDALEPMLVRAGDGQYCWGNSIGLADMCLVPQVYNARRWGVDVGRYPRITSVMAALEAIEPVAAAHPDRVKP